MMKAVEIIAPGDAAMLKSVMLPRPEPQENDVLIAVHAAGLNRPDILQRQGHYPPPPGASDLPGLEVAGEIVESRAPGWRKGDPVCALLAGGGYAEYVTAPAGQCLPVPPGLSMNEAAALPEAVFTVWNNLFYRGRLARGETVLIHGGASGIGTTAIQMSKQAGATPIITAGSAEKCAACIKLGASIAIHYKTHDFETIIRESCPDGVDIILDMVGGDYVPRNLALLKTDGRHVSIAFLRGAKTTINLQTIMQKRIIMTGSTLRPRPIREKERLRDQILEHVWPHVAAGKIRPVLYRTFPLDQAASAHETLESGTHIGKIVLTVR